MRFNIWTFLFQVINFAVLLFVLKRVLYRPVKEIMEKRRGIVAESMEEAETAKKEAEGLKESYQEELNRTKELRLQMMEKMKEEVAEERRRLLLEAQGEAGLILDKERGLFEAEKRRSEAELKEKASEVVSAFALNIIKDVSDEELHRSIFRRFLGETGKMASEISGLWKEGKPVSIALISAYPLREEEIKMFREALGSSLSKEVNIGSVTDSALIAGVKIKAFDMVYDFSVSGQIEALKMKLKEMT